MPKRKSKTTDTIEDLFTEIESAKTVVEEEVKKLPKEQHRLEGPRQVIDDKRDKVLKLAEDGEIPKSVAYVNKASQNVIDKLYTEYERKRMKKSNEFLTDLLISKFSTLLGGLDAIESEDELTDELKKDELLKRDVLKLVEMVTPYIPLLGILSGGVTTAKYVYSHKTKPSVAVDETQ